MATYMNYCKQLKFDEEPNYAFLKRLFKELYNKCCFEHEYIFDWTIQRFRVEEPAEHEEERKLQNVDGGSTHPESLKCHLGDGKSSADAIEYAAQSAGLEKQAERLEHAE